MPQDSGDCFTAHLGVGAWRHRWLSQAYVCTETVLLAARAPLRLADAAGQEGQESTLLPSWGSGAASAAVETCAPHELNPRQYVVHYTELQSRGA